MISDLSFPQRPRVLHIITRLALGGAERVALDLVYGLRSRFEFGILAVRGIESSDIGKGMQSEIADIQVPLYRGIGLPMKFGGLMFSMLYTAKTIAVFQPQIIHLHTEIPEASFGALPTFLRKVRRVPVIRTIHNAVYWEPWRKLGRWCDQRLEQSYVACVSNAARDAFYRLRAESNAGKVPLEPMVIYNGVTVKGRRKQRLNKWMSPVRVLYAGRFEHQKGVDLLPDILHRVGLQKGLHCHLTAYGTGAHEGTLRRLAASPPRGWTVEVKKPHPNLKAELQNFDLLIMPSRYEGLGLVAVEAALMNLPAVVTTAPGLREVFPEDYMFAAVPGDAAGFAHNLMRALNDPVALFDAAVQANRFALYRFDAKAMCDAYTGLYLHTLQQAGTALPE